LINLPRFPLPPEEKNDNMHKDYWMKKKNRLRAEDQEETGEQKEVPNSVSCPVSYLSPTAE